MSSDNSTRPRFVAHSPSRGFYLGSGYWSLEMIPPNTFADGGCTVPTFSTREKLRHFVGRSNRSVPIDWNSCYVLPDLGHKRASLGRCRDAITEKEGAD